MPTTPTRWPWHRAGNLLGEPETIIARALQADGSNIKALALAGTAAFERKDYAKAIEYWAANRIAGAARIEYRAFDHLLDQ